MVENVPSCNREIGWEFCSRSLADLCGFASQITRKGRIERITMVDEETVQAPMKGVLFDRDSLAPHIPPEQYGLGTTFDNVSFLHE